MQQVAPTLSLPWPPIHRYGHPHRAQRASSQGTKRHHCANATRPHCIMRHACLLCQQLNVTALPPARHARLRRVQAWRSLFSSFFSRSFPSPRASHTHCNWWNSGSDRILSHAPRPCLLTPCRSASSSGASHTRYSRVVFPIARADAG